MKPHARIRKTIKWTGAALAVLLIVVWIGSRSWAVGYTHTTGHFIELTRGRLSVGSFPIKEAIADGIPVTVGAWRGRDPRPKIEWGFGSAYSSSPSWNVLRLPLWIPLGIFLIVTISCWRQDIISLRRERAHLCAKCRYDRTGLAADVKCPECGVAPGGV